MKTSTNNTIIFHSIIEDLNNMIEQLRLENENMNQLIMDNEKLKTKLQEYENKNYYGNLTLYLLVMSLSIFLALPPNITLANLAKPHDVGVWLGLEPEE